jgi:hypothetical protein
VIPVSRHRLQGRDSCSLSRALTAGHSSHEGSGAPRDPGSISTTSCVETAFTSPLPPRLRRGRRGLVQACDGVTPLVTGVMPILPAQNTNGAWTNRILTAVSVPGRPTRAE